MRTVFDLKRGHVVAKDDFAKEFDGGCLEVVLVAFPHKLIETEDGDQLVRDQVAALREFADAFEAQLAKPLPKEIA